ncbi:MAG: UDP-N-acetylglucosamine 2-epimerase [Candidatus Puniceispirillaceae bacterium]
MLIHYVSGSRADFGLMERCLLHVHKAPRHDVGVIATGQHMVAQYGNTRDQIIESGLPLIGEIPVQLSGESGSEMCFALADELKGFVSVWTKTRPDLVLLLGDRGEMVAAALAAVHLGIHVAHIHGGERTGTLDESFRHVITKLSHFHFPATQDAYDRLVKMGELEDHIHIIGAPGLVGIAGRDTGNSASLLKDIGLDHHGDALALCVFHPVVQEADKAAEQMQLVVEATQKMGYALVILHPNSDAGGAGISAYLNGLAQNNRLRILTHLDRDRYLDLLNMSDLLIGNSSSGIIESASFAVPCVNIGARQKGRLRNANTFDCPHISSDKITDAIKAARSWTRSSHNIYGDGRADRKLLECLDEMILDPDLLTKKMAF